MRDWIRSALRFLYAHLVGDEKDFPVYRRTDGGVSLSRSCRHLALDSVTGDCVCSASAIQTFEEDRFRVRVLLGLSTECCEECGMPILYLLPEFRDPFTEEWAPLLLLHESNLGSVLRVLRDAEKFVTTTSRVL